MAIDSLEAILFLEPAPSSEATLRLAAELVKRCEGLRSRLLPLDDEQRDMLAEANTSRFDQDGKIILLTNEHLQEQVDEGWMLQVVLWDEGPSAQATLRLSPQPSSGEKVEPSWSLLVEILPIAVEVFRPTLSLCNGISTDESIDSLPSFEELKPSALPPVITPWTHIGGDRLDEGARGKLANLDVYRSTPLAGGWLVQVVQNYFDQPARTALKQLQMLARGRIKYTHTRS